MIAAVVSLNMRKLIVPLLFTSLFLSSCWWINGRRPNEPYRKVWGYKPVFSNDPELYKIKSEAPRAMKVPGKIYVRGNLIFQADIGSGIHVIDKTDPANVKPVGFIKVIGNSDMSITGNYMYVNSITSLVVVDISDWRDVKEVKRIPDAFIVGAESNTFQPMIPLPEKNVYYECTSLYSPGQVQTGWIRDSVYNYCYYN